MASCLIDRRANINLPTDTKGYVIKGSASTDKIGVSIFPYIDIV